MRWGFNPLMSSETIGLFDLGHQGDFDRTLLAKMVAMTPAQRLHHHERWRTLLRRSHEPMPPFLEDLVKRLVPAGVEFVVVGGVSAVLHGATITTRDLDLCYRRTPENIVRLVAALSPLQPRPRGFPPDLPFVFDERTVQMGANFTLEVGDEALDLLGDMSGIGGYEQIIANAVGMEIAGLPVKVLSLGDLIRTKTAANRPKDLAVLPELRLLQESKQQGPSNRDPSAES
jgi:predicted nucleotidyltransferase